MSAHAHRSVDTNSPALDALQAIAVVAVFGFVVLLCLNAFAQLPIFWEVGDAHAAAAHEAPAAGEAAEPAAH